MQERLKRQESVAKIIRSGESGKVLRKESSPSQVQPRQTDKANNYVQASPDLVTNRNCLDILVKIYAELILYNMTPSVMVELYYLMQMLTVCVIVGTEERSEQVDKCYLSTTHNCVYFATNVLLLILDILKLFDKGTIKLLSENPRVQLFSEELQKHLLEYLESPLPAPVLNQAQKSPIGSVSFQSDTDNRNNFPSGQAFHIFRKQRDMFYEMIRIWEENHLTSGWSYGQALGARIRHLLSLHPSSSNFAHFARLFQSQLLNMCRGDDDQAHWQQDPDGLGLLMLLKKQQPEKYKRLYERLVTPSKFGGPCPPPSFPGSQEFFRDFITTASSYVFNQHLKDVLISHIQMLNDQEFVILEPEETDPVDVMVCGEARSVVLNLRVLAKFLGFLEFLPYQTSEHIPENIVATHIDLRSKVCPPVNLCAALRQCASTGQLVVGVTWMVEFFSMVDPVALHSRHYLTVVMILVAVFRLLYVVRPVEPTGCQVCDVAYTTRSLTPYNGLLLKLLLGWLFDLPNFPDGLFFIDVGEIDIDYLEYSQTLDVLKANYRHLCVTCLRCLFTPTDDVMDRRTAEINTVLTQKGVSPHKDLKPTKGTGLPLTKTPSKQNIKGSPSKTPSKFLSVSMIESPQTTPLKGSDTQIVAERKLNLDESNFVDQQMITICCPFISELKNLLSDYWVGGGCSKGTNSYRKITPLSASDRTTSTHSQMQLQVIHVSFI
ncbi:codanin-1-like isoform X1 [Homarus americanus]|uniref:codanin-1-like isoform X1 n=1 Tax=Homarus americanus TaxID=6706 RepID=UPI001C452EAD|nr:codanin-1-like isoform X1 [Homarus americanus]